MPPAHNLALASFDDALAFPDERLGQEERTEGYLAAVDTDAVYARQLQSLLALTYTEVSPEEKLPVRQRILIIIGLTSFLWALIAAGIFAVF